MGGSISAIEQEFQQNLIASSAFDYQTAIEKGEKIIVGLNKYQLEETDVLETQIIDQNAVKQQLKRLDNFKNNRNMQEVKQALSILKATAKDGGNLMPNIIYAVKKHATLGEISDIFRDVFGEY